MVCIYTYFLCHTNFYNKLNRTTSFCLQSVLEMSHSAYFSRFYFYFFKYLFSFYSVLDCDKYLRSSNLKVFSSHCFVLYSGLSFFLFLRGWKRLFLPPILSSQFLFPALKKQTKNARYILVPNGQQYFAHSRTLKETVKDGGKKFRCFVNLQTFFLGGRSHEPSGKALNHLTSESEGMIQSF